MSATLLAASLSATVLSLPTHLQAIDKFDPFHPRKERVPFRLFML